MKKILLLFAIGMVSTIVFSQQSPTMRNNPTFSKGDVVCSTTGDLINDGELSISNTPYDEHIVGVYSGVTSVAVKRIFLTEGIADVKFDHSSGDVKKGDWVTSGSSGKAIKASQNGFVLGVALESSEGKDMVKIRVMIQYVKQ